MELLKLNAEVDENNEIDYAVEFGEETEKQFKNSKYKQYIENEVISAFIDGIHCNDDEVEVPVEPMIKIEIGRDIVDKEGNLPLMIKEGEPLISMKQNVSEPRNRKLVGDFVENISRAIFEYLDAVEEEMVITNCEKHEHASPGLNAENVGK